MAKLPMQQPWQSSLHVLNIQVTADALPNVGCYQLESRVQKSDSKLEKPQEPEHYPRRPRCPLQQTALRWDLLNSQIPAHGKSQPQL